MLYSVTNACGTTTASYLINVNTVPNPGVITGPSFVGTSAMITLADGSAGGVWSITNADATLTGSGMVTRVTQGVDTVIYTVNNVCDTYTDINKFEIIDYHISGTPVVSTGSEINIYPNPTSSTLNIEWSELQTGKAYVVITDCVGREVLTNELTSNGANSGQLDLSGLDEGVYMLQVKTGSGVFTRKVVISK